MGAEEINALAVSQLPTGRKAFLALGVHLAQVNPHFCTWQYTGSSHKRRSYSQWENVSKLSGKEQVHLRRTEIGLAFQRFNLTLTVNC